MGLYGGFTDDEDRRSGSLAAILAIFGPLAAILIQLAISRSREFVAGKDGAQLIGSGKPLAKALLAINESTRRLPMLGIILLLLHFTLAILLGVRVPVY